MGFNHENDDNAEQKLVHIQSAVLILMHMLYIIDILGIYHCLPLKTKSMEKEGLDYHKNLCSLIEKCRESGK